MILVLFIVLSLSDEVMKRISLKAEVRTDAYATTSVRTPCKLYRSGIARLLLQLTVTAHEAVDTTGCIDKFALTSVERVRGA